VATRWRPIRFDLDDGQPGRHRALVHARLVLVHIAERERVLRRLVSALRPGGWLLIEDADPALQPLSCIDAQTPAAERANRLRAAISSATVSPAIRRSTASGGRQRRRAGSGAAPMISAWGRRP
jgi:trans-aconitate methyltransferase